MHAVFRFKAWRLLAHGAAVLGGTLVLGACATGYAYVQPEAAGSGSYDTSDVPYTGQGYYDYYGTGPYHPDANGWGYYNGTAPYAGAFGWFDGNFDDFGSPIFFDLGISDVWGFPGYWGPWYSIDFPIWDCWNGCWRHRHRHDHWRGHRDGHGHHDPHDSVAATNPSSRLWLKSDHSPVGSRMYRATARPVEGFASQRPLASTAFAPRDFERPPTPQPSDIGPRPAYRAPGVPAFAERPMQPESARIAPPRSFARPASAISFTPARAAASRPSSDHAASVKIP